MKKRFHRLTAVAMTIFIFCFSLPFAASAADSKVTLTFNAVIEGGIPEGCSVSVGSNLNGWNPLNSMWYASQIDKSRFTLSVSVDSKYIGKEIEYKWTLQYPGASGNGWEHTEITGGSGLLGNRKYVIKESDNIINDTPAFDFSSGGIQSTLTCGTLETVELENAVPGKKFICDHNRDGVMSVSDTTLNQKYIVDIECDFSPQPNP